MEEVSIIGIDVAKRSFQVHGDRQAIQNVYCTLHM